MPEHGAVVLECASVQSFFLTPGLQTGSLQREKSRRFSVTWLALWPTVNRPSLLSWSFRASEWRKEKSPSSFQSSSSSLQGALWHFSECTYSLPLPGDRWKAWYHSHACDLNMGLCSGGYHILVPAMSRSWPIPIHSTRTIQLHTQQRLFFCTYIRLAFKWDKIQITV